MKTSRVAIFHGAGRPFASEDVPVPPLRAGEILVRNTYATLCRSDLNTFEGKRTEKTPTILGHEIVGEIEALGPEAPATDLRGAVLAPGDTVTWAIYASDPCSCLARRGIPQKGADLFKYGHERATPESHLHGGLAEYCVLRRHTPVVRTDRAVPLPVLALVNCSVATVAGALRLAGDVRGQEVLVAGAGMLGVIACAMARAAGAARVIAADIDAGRLATAARFGADEGRLLGEGRPGLAAAVRPEDKPTVAIDFSGVPETMEAALDALAIGGVLVLVGATYPQRDLRVNAEKLVRNLHTVRGLHNYNAGDLVAAVEFVERHHAAYPFSELVHDRFDLDAVDAAFAYALASGAHRVGVRPVCRRAV